MSTDSRIDSDLHALAERTARGLPTIDDTARALLQARAHRKRGFDMSTIRKPLYATAAGIAVLAVALVFPVPYDRTVGYELTVRDARGHQARLSLPTRNPARAEARAAALRKTGAVVTVAPRTERVWGSVYAMVNDKLLHIYVETDGKTDAQIADEIRAQVNQAGWTPTDVQVQRSGDGSTVDISAADASGRQIRVVRKASGGGESKVDLEVGGFDDTREPGMTDAQLRDKILKQLHDRGLSGDVTVQGDRVGIRAERKQVLDE